MFCQSLRKAAFLMGAAGTSIVAALGQEPIVSFTSSAGSFQIAGGSVSAGQILVASNEYWGVIRAAGDLALDFGRVTGTNYTLSNGEKGSAAASYGYNPVNNMNNTFVSSAWVYITRGSQIADSSSYNTYSTRQQLQLPSPDPTTLTQHQTTPSSSLVPLAIPPLSTSW